MPNVYCDALGIQPPSLIGLALMGTGNYLDILVVALLEHGEPLTLDEVVSAVAPLSTNAPDSIRTSLQRAWAGRRPVVKEASGRFALDLESRRMRPILTRLGLLPPPPAPSAPPEYVPPAPEVALTLEDLKACFWRGCPSNFSGIRLAAAVLDVMDRPMLPHEILGVIRGWTDGWLPQPQPSRYQPSQVLVVKGEDGRLRLDRSRTADLHAMRLRVRTLAAPRLRQNAQAAWFTQRAEARTSQEAARAAAIAKASPPRSLKVAWAGTLVSVQPRVFLTRSFDQRTHSYLGYLLRVQGEMGGETREFLVGIGKAAQENHQFRVGDEVRGAGVRVEDTNLETADLYKVSGLKVGARGPAERSGSPPFTGTPPTLEEYRARGPRRLAARTYFLKCGSCLWGCEMAVEIILDQWNPSRRRYRRETFCYGPKSCALYAAGPVRKVPGRKGMSWTEEDWVDENETAHRGPDD